MLGVAVILIALIVVGTVLLTAPIHSIREMLSVLFGVSLAVAAVNEASIVQQIVKRSDLFSPKGICHFQKTF